MKRIQIASKSKRILSSLIDLSIIAGLFCLFYFLVFYKAVSAVQHFDNQNEVIKQERIKTGLYCDDGVTTILAKDKDIPYTKLRDSIKYYYTDYLYNKSDKSKITYTEYWYCVTILHLDDKLNLIENKTTYKDDQQPYKWDHDPTSKDDLSYSERRDKFNDNDYKDFYKMSFGTAVYNLSLNDLTPIKNAARTISFGTMRALLYSSIVSTLIPCFVIPISIKNGKTIGKLVTKLIVLTDEGYEYQRYKHIFRYLAFYGVEVFGGVITFGLTFILSTSLVLFSKKHRALHDYIAFSCVADEKNSVFYKDENEENDYKDKSITDLSLE